MMQDCASANKIKENKYKILRMSILLGSDEDQVETLNNFEDAAREIDAMNDEIYLKDLEDKFYDTKTLEEEEKKLAILVDYIGGRVEQRISLLSDFSNVTGFDLSNLPSIKYYDKLDDYKDRLKYIRQYLQNTEQLKILNEEIEQDESKLKDAYMNKATSEECNKRNEEILFNKFQNILKTNKELRDLTEDNIDYKLNEIIGQVDESKKSLDIFNKSFATLSGSGISYEEEEEYKSYVENAKTVYYCNKEQEYLLRIYQHLLRKEIDYNSIIIKRDSINELLYDRINLRKELQVKETDSLNSIYDLLERQYEDIVRQKENIENIEFLTDEINNKKEQLNDLELDNQKVEILSLLREYGLIDTYTEESSEEPLETSFTDSQLDTSNYEIENSISNETIPSLETEKSISVPEGFDNHPLEKNYASTEKEEASITIPTETITEPPKANEIILVETATQIDLDLIQAKAGKVMQRVGEMLGIKTKDTKIVNVENTKPEPVSTPMEQSMPESIPEEPVVTTAIPENPLFNNDINNEISPETPPVDPEMNNFWFESETPDALNELPDLPVSNDNFFANNSMPDLNFPNLQLNFGNDEEEQK